MATIVTRLTNTGTLLINGTLDEITQSNISVKSNVLLAEEFDEVTNAGGLPARRDSANGTIQISGIFDEFTGAPVVDSNLTMLIDLGQSASYPGSGSTIYDISPAGTANLTLYNSPTFNSLDYGGSIAFNGSDQYALGSGTPLGLSAYTKSFWVKLSSYSGNNNTISSFAGGHFCYFAGTNKLHCGHADWSNYTIYPSTTTFNLNQWYHVCLTFNTTNGMNLYVNGSFDSSYNGVLTPVPGTGQVDLACYDAGFNLLTGSINQVMIYNRVLTADEAAQNFNAGRRRFGI
jgi:hypothetical protein